MAKAKIDVNYVTDYNNGMSIWEIAAKYGDTYRNSFEKATGVRFEYKTIPECDKDKICDWYLNGMSTVKIGKLFGTWNHTIANVLQEKGIDRDRRLSTRTYTLNEHYFDEIDTPTKAYIYGFLLTDGSNNPDKQTVSISLQEEDKAILERMRQEIESTKPLEYLDYSNKHDFGYHYKNQYRMLLFSDKICSALTKHGLVKNKSLVIEFPHFDDSLMPAFIRGVMDGDGSIGLYNKSTISVSLTATKMFCSGLVKYLNEKLGIESCSVCDESCHNGITKSLYIGKNADKIKFLEWIYNDADIYLERKHDKYLAIIDYYYNRSQFAKRTNKSSLD